MSPADSLASSSVKIVQCAAARVLANGVQWSQQGEQAQQCWLMLALLSPCYFSTLLALPPVANLQIFSRQ
jgi:hypothetical protein